MSKYVWEFYDDYMNSISYYITEADSEEEAVKIIEANHYENGECCYSAEELTEERYKWILQRKGEDSVYIYTYNNETEEFDE